MLTLNQVIQRIQTLCLSHSQVETFHVPKSEIDSFLNDAEIDYPCVVCDIQDGGGIDRQFKTASIPLKLYFLDLENIAEVAQGNTLEVWSDRVSVAQDIIAMMCNQSDYTDWRVDGGTSMQFFSEKFSDYVAGISVDVTIRLPYDVNRCQAPTD